jgi:hypothetical protein
MSHEELQSRFHDPLLQPISSISPSVSGKSLQWQVSPNQKKNCSMTDLLLKAAASVAARRCIMKFYVL